MKKRNWFMVIVLTLLVSLSLIGSAGATTAGFNVDCTGAFGFGSVPPGDTYRWRIRYWDPPNGRDDNFSGDVSNVTGTDPVAFNPVVLWPTTPSGGSDPDATYYWIDIWSDVAGADIYHAEGHFVCVTPTPTPPPPGQGCTPGFWKNHLALWPAPYTPGTDFDTTFGTNYFTPDITLRTALNLGGGGVNKLARHGTAALLNAASGINYPYTVAQVIALVQGGVGNADTLAAANELGCPLR